MLGGSETPHGPPSIVIDLETPQREITEGHVGSAGVKICLTAIEELTHLLEPEKSDKEMNAQTTELTEKFLGIKFTDEQKKELAEDVSGDPKDGIFRIR
jgi:hypothetical protein